MRIFWSSILRTDLKCSIQKAHNGNCLQCWWGVFIPLYTCFFCIALLYKMCLEIVVIYSSRNTTGYTVVLWNSWDERELNRLLFLHCLVLWRKKDTLLTSHKNLNACIFLGGISEGTFATLLMPLFFCPKLRVRVAIGDSWECMSEVCKVKCRFGIAFVYFFYLSELSSSKLRFCFFWSVGQYFMTPSNSRKFSFKWKRSSCRRRWCILFEWFLLRWHYIFLT